MKEELNLLGNVYGRLTVFEYAGKNKHGSYLWKCKCSCGNETTVISSSLRKGATKSCGCLSKEILSQINSKHSMRSSRFYRIWSGIKKRCDNQNSKEFMNYGGRGITYQSNWKDFVNFKQDMYDAYLEHCKQFGEDNTSIDRKDNSKGYSKKNCKWSTVKEQQRNTRYNKYLIIDGEKILLSDAAVKYGIDRSTLGKRLKSGWNHKKAIVPPKNKESVK